MKKIYYSIIIVVFLFGNLLPEAFAQNQIINNGNLRFGTGTESSINATGNVKQPFYFNPSENAWRKLTFSTYPLDYSFAIGGTGTSEWNLEGTRVDNPNMASQAFDDSGFTYTSGQTGWGVLKVKGNISVGSAVLEVENTYELLQDKKFTRVTTVVKNVSGTPITNLRYWIGTRDDYVGIDDRPRKQKGNLSDGAFEPIASAATRAAALLISSGNEGILFYTTSEKGNTIIQSCCNWLNVISQDPSTSTVDITGDGSYGFYVRMNDLGIGETDEFTWFYAAAPLDELEDVIADVAAASSSVTNITAESASLNAKASITGTGYWITVDRGATAPTPEQVKAGINYGDVLVVASGSGAMIADVERAFDMTGLSHDTAYDTYFVAEDDTPEFTALTRSQFRTLPVSPTGITATATDLCSGGSTQLSAEGGYGTVYWYSASCEGTQVGTGSSITVSPGTTTSYFARNFSNNFSEACASVEITVHPFPAAPTAGNLTTDYNGDTHAASATAPEGSSVVWYSTQTGTLETTAPAGSNAGTYSAWAASVNNAAGCESTQRTLVTLTINPKTITVVNALVVDKNYDGNFDAEIINATLAGVEIDDDVVLINYLNGNFAQNNVGSDIQVTTAMGIDGADTDNYLLQQPNITGSITPRPVTVNVEPEQSKVYGEQDPSQFSWIFSGSLADGETFEGELLREVGEPVGSYAIQQGSLTIVKEPLVTIDNYHFVFNTENFTVLPAELFVYANDESKTYGNSDPLFSANYNGFVYNEDESVLTGELILNREQGESTGLYAITPSGLISENYAINFVDGELEIIPAELIVTANSVDKVYGNSDPVFSVSYQGFAFDDNESVLANVLEFVREPGEQAGIYAITPFGLTSQDYAITFIDGELQVNPAALIIATNDTSKTYGESDPDFSATFTGFVFEETESVLTGEISFSRVSSEDAGYYAVTPSGLSSGNYTLSFTDGHLEILPAELHVIAENSIKTYGETDPVYTADLQGFVFDENASVLNGTLEFSREQGENAGQYYITPSGLSASNYSISFTNGLLEILPAELVVTASSKVKVYGQPDPEFFSTYSGFVYNEDESVLTGELTHHREQGELTGLYAVTPAGLSSENYAINFVDAELEIIPAELTVTANSVEKIYGDSDPVFSVRYQGLAFDDNESVLANVLEFVREPGEQTGIYAITPFGLTSQDYAITFIDGELQVNPATLMIATNDTSKTYGESDPDFSATFTGFVFEETESVLTGEISFSRVSGENAGYYAVTPSGLSSGNYTLSFTDGHLEILPAELHVIAENSIKTYGETDPVFTAGFQGFVFDENASVLNGTLEFSREQGENAGQYYITPSGLSASNYSISFTNGLLEILPAELVVTASSKVKVYGQPDPEFFSTYSGFVYNEDEFVLTGELTHHREQGESTGLYAVTPTGLSSENYAIKFVDAELEIIPSELTVTANSVEKIYGNSDPVLSVSYQGFAFDDNENHLSGNLTMQREPGENTGNYRITASGLNSENYNLVFEEAWFTIAPALLKVEVVDTTKIYGYDDPEFVLDFSGFAFQEEQSVLEGTPIIARAEGESVGVYNLSVTGFTSLNYVLEYIDGELTITTRPIYITGSFEVADKEFDGTPYAQIISNTLRLSGGLKKDELKLGKILAKFESIEPAENIVVKIASANFSGLQKQNYELLLDNSPTTLADIFIVYYQLELYSNLQDAGQITGAGSFEAGKKTALTAVANPGYLFLNWTDEEGVIVSSEAEFKYTMPDRNISLVANFELASSVQDNHVFNVRLYPNPSSTIINVEADSRILHMSISDITGRTIKTLHDNGQELKSVNVSDLYSGIYILLLTTEKGTGTYKINVKN